MRENNLKKIYKMIDNGDASYKMKNLPAFPKIIEFEITNNCNFNCIMCPTGTGAAKRDRGYMTDELFYKVISELSERNVALKFVGQGEPLLHPKAIDWIIYAKRHGIITHLTTNGSLLTKTMMEQIVETQALDSIKFSFQGVDAEGYRIIRRKNEFQELMEKIEQLHIIRGDKDYPYITIGTSITCEKDNAVDSFIKSAQMICDKVEVGRTNLERSQLSAISNDVIREELERLRYIQETSEKKRYVCCPQVFDTIAVRWNGDITACCSDTDGLMTLGNIYTSSILECWNGSKENAYRNILAEGRYCDIEVCKTCYDIYGWTYGNN